MNGTEHLYLDDSYQTTFEARVVEIDDRNIFLDRTLFHPRGGSQMSDRGVLTSFRNIFPILAVERRGRSIAHTLDCHPPKVGQAVTGRLDWDFRYQMMRTHTALHILSAVLREQCHADVTTTQVYADRTRIRVPSVDLFSVDIGEIERLVNIIVDSGHPVRVRHVASREARLIPNVARTNTDAAPTQGDIVRVIEIIGLDLRVDDGTHVANTLEVGGISLTTSHGPRRTDSQLEMRLTPVH